LPRSGKFVRVFVPVLVARTAALQTASATRYTSLNRPHTGMTLLTAHKIFISSAVALFVLCAGWELRHFAAGDDSALLRSGLSAGAAVGLAIYLRWVWIRRPGARRATR
jgi:hypothetical protein